MKILNVNKFYYNRGGSETAYFALSNLLENRGHEVVPFSMKDKKNLPTPYEKFFVEHVSYEDNRLFEKVSAAIKIIDSIEARQKMVSLLQEVTPDLAHFHIFQHQISPSVFGPLKKRGIPLVLTLHDL